MFKKFIAVSSLLFSMGTYAGNFYLAPMLTYEDVSSGDLTYRGIAPRLAAGYSTAFNGTYYLAPEFYISPKSITLHSSNDDIGSIKPTNTYGLSIIPGIFLDHELLAYLRLGVVSSRFSDLNATKRGVQAGAGLETCLKGPWSIRAEYDYTVYQSIGGVGNPRTGQFGVGTIYRFG